MIETESRPYRVAVLDLNAGHPNQGMRCISEVVYRWAEENNIEILYDVYDVRVKNELPDTSYDMYISSGGPGDPLSSRFDDWDINWNKWLRNIIRWNENPQNLTKKFVFLICHSFQLASRYFNAGLICKRKSTSFGIFPIHLMPDAIGDPVFEQLNNPFYAVDSRDFQLIQPNLKLLHEIGATITCIEKERPHIPYERAVMSIRFNDYIFGTQFHPEADAAGMTKHFQSEDKRATVIKNYGEAKLSSMLEHLDDPDKIYWTNKTLIPNFLNVAYNHLMVEELMEAE
ncbi:MAG TPA: GMP synthase [Niabella sp.]|nr:GMP synthase [Niabella sp.]HQW15002.1 GMP synthase [Niabella sp.]HQX20106.1 GMP synthase [Niabella sp.]HQX40382.1 GMP synthase [Niabella sp.]HRB06711.1 GMP synthase [Niabella sp.]